MSWPDSSAVRPAWCADAYGRVVDGKYTDDGVPGAIPLASRPAGWHMLDNAPTSAFGTMRIFRLDRLRCTLVPLLDVHAGLHQVGVSIRSGTKPFDASTPVGRYLSQLLGNPVELDGLTIVKRLAMGQIGDYGGQLGGSTEFVPLRPG